ncbi:MAG: hypothetical protein RSE41_03085 [Clostridia bacterium]
MFGNNMFGSNNTSNLDDLRRQYERQMQQLQYVQQQQQEARPSSIIEEMNKEILSLSQDERDMLSQNEAYIAARQIYEASFMEFLGNKFSAEFVNGEGKSAAENMLNSIKQIKTVIQNEARDKKRKLEALSKLMEQDDDIANKVKEMIKNK